MIRQPSRIHTKPCHLCGHALPLYSTHAGRLCAICRCCPTCGRRNLGYYDNEEVQCLTCGNSWDTHRLLESDILRTYKVKCLSCSEVIPSRILQLEAKVCPTHLTCPTCSNLTLVKTDANPLKVIYVCTTCGWKGNTRKVELQFKSQKFDFSER